MAELPQYWEPPGSPNPTSGGAGVLVQAGAGDGMREGKWDDRVLCSFQRDHLHVAHPMGTWHDRREARALGNSLLLGLVAVLILCWEQNGMCRQAQILWQLLTPFQVPTHPSWDCTHFSGALGMAEHSGKGQESRKCSLGFLSAGALSSSWTSRWLWGCPMSWVQAYGAPVVPITQHQH